MSLDGQWCKLCNSLMEFRNVQSELWHEPNYFRNHHCLVEYIQTRTVPSVKRIPRAWSNQKSPLIPSSQIQYHFSPISIHIIP